MRRTFNCLAVICFSLLCLGTSTPAQAPGAQCPTITVDCPTQIIEPGETATISATIEGADPSLKLTYNWSVSAGTIIAGQGTQTITIDTTGTAGQTSTATVELGGLDSSCHKIASCSLVPHHSIVSRRFDKYGDLAFEDEKKRLDYFAEQLKNEPDSQGYIMVYGKRGALAGEAEARATRAKDYLVTKRAIAAERLVTIDGGDHERFAIELWLTPQGGQPPSPLDQYGESREGN
ncbi:MAG TPA: hypothetical protein VE842_14295 [Pyrinomonadaceae bacterium]|nr:hypothetical protein [Pyrinomonadaceae bacterium]